VHELTLRPVTAADLPGLAALNDAAVPAVNLLGLEGARAHVPRCDLALVAEADGDIVGFVLAIAPGADYASENYRWFAEHLPGSLYVDRIVVAPAAHGRGVGRALYMAVDARARELGLGHVTCEVNLQPPNPRSLAFHERLGFTRVGEQATKGGSVVVALLRRDVAEL
jgi:predicted GNAT superfamily acetyltransferase